MSLLDGGTETVTVYPEEMVIDGDGNKRTRPSVVGVLARAVVQPITGTVNAEGQEIGFETTTRYRLRLVGYL
jgi:hypothetical protein